MINTNVEIGGASAMELRHAILIYEGQGVFATVHAVRANGDLEPPYLAPGRPVTASFVRELAKGLGNHVPTEILPANVLVRTADLAVWWTPAKRRPLFFRAGSELGKGDGKVYPIPPLAWKLEGTGALYLRALERSERPDAETPLFCAPFWNTYETGAVCQGSMRKPDRVSVETLAGWEDGYFGSQFTHSAGARHLTKHKKGVVGLWLSLRGRRDFPVDTLLPARETLRQFVEGRDA